MADRPLDILLTTFPAHRSGNVGDHLITHSFMKMLRSRVPLYAPLVLFREECLDRYPESQVRSIVAPGFSVLDETYPKLFGLYTDLTRLQNFYPVGCSFQHTLPRFEAFENHTYGERTSEFLQYVVRASGPMLCRDQLIADMLLRNGIEAEYCGDLAIYDESRIGTQFVPPSKIDSLVFTIQHHDRYDDQSFEVLRQIEREFPGARRIVAFHSKPNRRSQKIARYAETLGFNAVSLCGDVENLKIYDAIDLHIGYRLHGHIAFLRRRKPSVLLVEDARSFGFANTAGTSVGCFDALAAGAVHTDAETPGKAIAFVRSQVAEGFSDYLPLFEFIDSNYAKIIAPYFDSLAKKFL